MKFRILKNQDNLYGVQYKYSLWPFWFWDKSINEGAELKVAFEQEKGIRIEGTDNCKMCRTTQQVAKKRLAEIEAELEQAKAELNETFKNKDGWQKKATEYWQELEQVKTSLEDTNNGRPSEWAYSILRKERDELKVELEQELARNCKIEAGEYYVVYHPDHSEPAESFVAEFNRLKEIVESYRSKLADLCLAFEMYIASKREDSHIWQVVKEARATLDGETK